MLSRVLRNSDIRFRASVPGLTSLECHLGLLPWPSNCQHTGFVELYRPGVWNVGFVQGLEAVS